MTVTVDVKVCQ